MDMLRIFKEGSLINRVTKRQVHLFLASLCTEKAPEADNEKLSRTLRGKLKTEKKGTRSSPLSSPRFLTGPH